jgi:hypothetical protein
LRVKSAPFKVFARKPTGSSSPTEEEKKRKLEVSLNEYFEHLEELIECSQNLEESERKPALDDAIHKLVSVETNSEFLRSTNLLPPTKRRFFSKE